MNWEKRAKATKATLKGRRMTGDLRCEWWGMRWQQKRKSLGRGVKTSDDSLCPLYGDCSLINLAAEILPPWAK